MSNAWDNSQADKFLAREKVNNDVIAFRTIYADMAGDTLAGLVLSQIVFWHLPDKDGNNKMKVTHDSHYWVATSRKAWHERTRLNPRQVDRVLNILVEKNLVVKRIYKFSGAPTTHIRINWDVFTSVYEDTLEITNALNGNHQTVKSISPNGEILGNHQTVKSITENTKENTKKTTKKEKNLSPVGEAVASENSQPLEANKNQPEADNTPQVKPSKTNDYEQSIRAIMLTFTPIGQRDNLDFENKSARGIAMSLQPQLAGKAKKTDRAQYNLETPLEAWQIIDFGNWYYDMAVQNGWQLKTPPKSADKLYMRVLEYQTLQRPQAQIERAKKALALIENYVKPAPVEEPVSVAVNEPEEEVMSEEETNALLNQAYAVMRAGRI